MTKDNPKLRMIMKFDVGAKGFERMIVVLAVTAVAVLVLGGYFIVHVFPTLIPR